MKFPTVEKFLCCLTLETGGLVLGWLGAIGAPILIVLIAVAIAATFVTSSEDSTL